MQCNFLISSQSRKTEHAAYQCNVFISNSIQSSPPVSMIQAPPLLGLLLSTGLPSSGPGGPRPLFLPLLSRPPLIPPLPRSSRSSLLSLSPPKLPRGVLSSPFLIGSGIGSMAVGPGGPLLSHCKCLPWCMVGIGGPPCKPCGNGNRCGGSGAPLRCASSLDGPVGCGGPLVSLRPSLSLSSRP